VPGSEHLLCPMSNKDHAERYSQGQRGPGV
jgi:hypothetical protein